MKRLTRHSPASAASPASPAFAVSTSGTIQLKLVTGLAMGILAAAVMIGYSAILTYTTYWRQSVNATIAPSVYAHVPGRPDPAGTSVPNPGTQQQELPNITFPGPYNVFEPPATCAPCHGGTIDQQTGHFGNWAGSNLASAARDPVFRANQIIFNNDAKKLTGKDGAGNLCFRCHSLNGWYSGRFEPALAGSADGSTMIYSIKESSDSEGVPCELCHRTIGAVTMKRKDLDPLDPVWNMLSGIDDWPHSGLPYPEGPAAGNPYGDATLQINEGKKYGADYLGTIAIYFSDTPIERNLYTGQTYGMYPPDWPEKSLAGKPAINPDGTLPLELSVPLCPPYDPDSGTYNYQEYAASTEHATFRGDFLASPELCASCHDLTIPVLNSGMPEQRIYSEWKYSDYGRTKGSATYRSCNKCHMPVHRHEYSDATPVSLNADPKFSGWFPYAKDRNPDGGIHLHKFAGANRDLPMMMMVLYPEVDLAVVGIPTGRNTGMFPGMLSSRDLSWDRARRNTELSLESAVDIRISSGPVFKPDIGKWEVRVRVTNLAGHRIPAGFPDGRRLWIRLVVRDESGRIVFESGYYDPERATLFNDSTKTGLSRALRPAIDSGATAVMIYEQVTGTCEGNSCKPSANLLNDRILFDNRIPPAGFIYADFRQAGARFWNYDPSTYMPREDTGRYTDGQNWDEVTYTFTALANPVSMDTHTAHADIHTAPATTDIALAATAPAAAAPAATDTALASPVLSARVEAYWQTHTREYMEYLKENDTSTLSPKGPPNPADPNYPHVPTYLRDVVGLSGMTDLDGKRLRDNWGGIAYASWLLSGKGEPFLVASDDTAIKSAPGAPSEVTAASLDPFSIQVTWSSVPGAEGYDVWVRYGKSDQTASWDKLAVVYGKVSFVNDGLKSGKTYAYKVTAFNGKGHSPDSAIVMTTTPLN
ncbi:MAG: fibronectin type III domain-containing protein [bacterium]